MQDRPLVIVGVLRDRFYCTKVSTIQMCPQGEVLLYQSSHYRCPQREALLYAQLILQIYVVEDQYKWYGVVL